MMELEIQNLINRAIEAREMLIVHIHISLLALLYYAKMAPFTKDVT